MLATRGGFRGGRFLFLRYSTPCRPKRSLFWYFLRNLFLADPKIFLKAPLAPIYTNLEGERAPKKRDFFVKTSQKVPINGFCDLFFQNLPAAQKIWPKQRLFCFRRARKINLIDLKKKVVKIFEIFLKSAPSRNS